MKTFTTRRSFLAAAAGTAGALWLDKARGRDYGPGAPPVRYPDPDIVALDKRFEEYKLGNTPIQRLYHSPEMLWAEGPAWNGVGKYLLWSDIPNNVQMRWLEEDGHVSVFRNPAGNSNGNTFDYQGPADLLRARQPPRGPLRAQRQDHGAGRQVRRQAAQRPQRRRRASRRRRDLVHRPRLRQPDELRREQGRAASSRRPIYRIDAKTRQARQGGRRHLQAQRPLLLARLQEAVRRRHRRLALPRRAARTSRSGTWSTARSSPRDASSPR